MTLNQLKYIVELSKDSSINEAAKKLFISQPSLTASLKSLERKLDSKFSHEQRAAYLLPSRDVSFWATQSQ